MRLANYLRDSLIFLDIEAKDKEDAIAKIIDSMYESKTIFDLKKFLGEVNQRENLGSTGIGKGVALPHARTQNVKEIVIAATRLKAPVDFNSEDKQPVQLIFLLGTPLKAVGEYLQVLARLSKLLREDKIRKSLLKANSPVQVRKIFEDAEN